jgi:type I restriction enzyme S subunit
MSSRAPIGYVAIPTVEFCTNQGCKSICLKDSFDTEFIYYNILFNIVKVKNLGEGTTFAEISKTALSAVTLAFPTSKPEQAKIAEVLSTVDRAIAQTEALIAKQQRIKAGLMHDLLTRGIDEHGTLRSEETHAFKDSPLGRIPAEWGVKRLDSVATFVTSGARGWARYYSKEGAIFIRIGNLTREHINLRLDDLVFVQPPEQAEGKRTSVAEGDILISITADLGITGVVPRGFGEAYVNQHIALVRLNRENICPRFMGWFLSSRKGQEQFEHLNESGAKAGLNLPTVRSLVLPYPSLDEQQMIASLVDASVKAYNEYLNMQQKLRALKTALMQDLLTGTRRVTALLEPEEASV